MVSEKLLKKVDVGEIVSFMKSLSSSVDVDKLLSAAEQIEIPLDVFGHFSKEYAELNSTNPFVDSRFIFE